MNFYITSNRLYLVYKITNLLDNKFYIGVHATYNKDDSYMGSGTEIRQEIKKLGKRNFKKEILHVFDNKEDMLAKETEIVNKEFIMQPNTYNRMLGGGGYVSLGRAVARDVEGKIYWVFVDDPRYVSRELYPCWLGMNHKFESKLQIGAANAISNLGDRNHMFNKQQTREVKNKITFALLEYYNKKNNNNYIFYVYNLSGKFLFKVENVTKFIEETGIKIQVIIKLLAGKSEYEEKRKYRMFKEFKGDQIEEFKINLKSRGKSKRVMNVSTGQIYDEIKLAAIDLKTSLSGLAQRIREGKKCKGIEFVYC